MTTEKYIIKTKNLSKTYGLVQVLEGLDLRVPEHSIFGFLGPNGAGKTTTMKLLIGLIRPTSGSGKVFNRDIFRESTAIRSRIGYLPQQPRFISDMTARETLRFTAGFFYAGPKIKIEERVKEMLDLAGLEEMADRPVKGFSGGERQRLGLAQAQINEPDLLILDEPSAALDPIGRLSVMTMMKHLRERTTIFYSTHILDDVQEVSNTVAILNHGKLIAQGPIESLLTGSDKPIYTLQLSGDTRSLQKRITALPWVVSIDAARRNGATAWQVIVNDETVAKEQLLRQVLADDSITIIEFQRKKYELEEVFAKFVEGDNHDRR